MRECILASASPRRKEILEHLGVRLEVFPADVDESTDESDPERFAEELSARKGRAARSLLIHAGRNLTDRVLIASDTAVSVDGEILGKPRDEADARRMLHLLRGRTHRVVSGIYLSLNGQEALSHAVTEVELAPMSDCEVEMYLRTGEPYGKAGAYAIQGTAALWVRAIHGDYYNVVGLPVNRMYELYAEKFGKNFL